MCQPGPLDTLTLEAIDSPSSGKCAGKVTTASMTTPISQLHQSYQYTAFGGAFGNEHFVRSRRIHFLAICIVQQSERLGVYAAQAMIQHPRRNRMSRWAKETATCVMLGNKDNDFEFWWEITNITTKLQEDHPSGLGRTKRNVQS
jgi:hypothetical protein